MLEPYARPPPGQAADYRGYLQLTEETIHRQFAKIYRHGWQINAMCLGMQRQN